ncbi:Uncharacterised protein [Collinsella intestinalis]|uniref:Uncharacterized protein n=1 Tax=Collinsella intestinalis TaxID=147207 RepID=A0A5K1ISU9_9ACTN|nr:hypothetical protein [Collinsella intestinalis]VWL91720.1 Uncharacterised protein [Collinsella intestinalis]
MAKSDDRFLVRASQDVSLDGEIWGAEVHMSDGSTKTYGIAGADGQAEAARKEAETARVNAEANRAEDEAARVDAESKRVTAEQERAAQQVKNNADQAANNAAAQGLQVVKLNEGQFDPDTLMPTVSGEVGKLYFVPIPSQAMSALAALMDVPAGDGQDNYLEWMSIDGKWERVGMSNATLVGLTTDEIDRIAAGEQVASESVLGGTGLTYLWAKLKTAFAALTHKHVTGDVTGLDAALGDKATKAELKTVQDSLGRFTKSVTICGTKTVSCDSTNVQLFTKQELDSLASSVGASAGTAVISVTNADWSKANVVPLGVVITDSIVVRTDALGTGSADLNYAITFRA